jgi:hypothetical protein
MKVVHLDDCLLHNPPREILSGKEISYFESPTRYLAIRDALSGTVSTRVSFELVKAELFTSPEIETFILSVKICTVYLHLLF